MLRSIKNPWHEKCVVKQSFKMDQVKQSLALRLWSSIKERVSLVVAQSWMPPPTGVGEIHPSEEWAKPAIYRSACVSPHQRQ